jgi:AcrR family transcriptional regulator
MAGAQRPARVRSVTRGRILETAEELFFTGGYQATSVEAIAAAAGYTTGAIYSNFGGKAALFLEVLEQRAERTLDAARETLAAPRTDDEKLAVLIATVVDRSTEWRSNMATTLEFLADIRRQDSAYGERFRLAQEHVETALVEIVGGACAALGVDQADKLVDVARDILALAQGYGLRALLDEDFAIEPAIASGVTALLTGLRTDVRSIAPAPRPRRRSPKTRVG